MAADKLEKDLVHIAVEDSVDSDDGGKSVIREMCPFEAETVWILGANEECFAPSALEILGIINDSLEALFVLPIIPMHAILLPQFMFALDKSLQQYILKAKAGCEDGMEKRLKFKLSKAASVEGIHQLSETMAYKVIFHDLRHVLWDDLYVGEVSSTRIEPFSWGA
ncbi:hypothetical protein LR48_Vigan05g134900 [Vigna angularis]|uniref:PATROL1-like C-terminal domain-containing protein n=1 Tax=Phaseolus angularis TaxID=3914 RepID=A0A0L9UMH0_PHAAN|nr:uncharacterized protein HKW66_Vig0219230 [Vigna angularis]KOM43744.1 hypothetical protein LR48_Vigan05g134900 [Vigna angularis]